jgi:hypothetical protein
MLSKHWIALWTCSSVGQAAKFWPAVEVDQMTGLHRKAADGRVSSDTDAENGPERDFDGQNTDKPAYPE